MKNLIVVINFLLFGFILNSTGTLADSNNPANGGVHVNDQHYHGESYGNAASSNYLPSSVLERNLKWGDDDDDDGDDCDEKDGPFYIAGSGKRSCADHYSAKPSLCSTNYIMKKKCQITCGFCSNSCEDYSGSFFMKGKKRFCSNATKLPNLCKSSYFEKKCPKACGECETEAPTASPCENSSGFIKINSKKRFCKFAHRKFCKNKKFKGFCPVLCNDCPDPPTPEPTSPPTTYPPTSAPTMSSTVFSSVSSSGASSGSSTSSSSSSSS
jgi:hypothetical protein